VCAYRDATPFQYHNHHSLFVLCAMVVGSAHTHESVFGHASTEEEKGENDVN
jgi:hypothetical protein